MKLDRNNPNSRGRGKYALINLRKLAAIEDMDLHSGLCSAIVYLQKEGILEWGEVGSPDEFFVIKLKDYFADGALLAYAAQAATADLEWSAEIRKLALRSGPHHPLCKMPD